MSYTFSEACASASITWFAMSGAADAGSPHVKALGGSELAAGVHTSIYLANNPDLKDGTTYSITFACAGTAGESATPVVSTNVTYIPVTASRVYGQFGSFVCNVSNNNGSCISAGITASANSLNQPNAVAFDSGGSYIADKGNNRVLYFPTGSTTASRVYGQSGNFTTGTANAPGLGGSGANCLSLPTGVATDAGGLYVADSGNNRVLYFAGTSTTASRVYGQFNVYTCNIANNAGGCSGPAFTADGLSGPQGVATDGSGVYIADYNNSRVLYYAGVSITATRVYGQVGNMNSNGAGTTADFLSNPYRVAVDASGVYVADFSNNRVVFYPGTSIIATRVYGQFGDLTCGTANNTGACVGAVVSANSLSSPSGIALDTLGVYIADLSNHRVLFYPGTSTTATRVYGQQGSFSTGGANNGGISAKGLNQPIWTAIDSEGLYIMDATNHRGLFY